MNIIKLGLHKQKPGAPQGYMTLDRMLTLADVLEQVKEVLKRIPADEKDEQCTAFSVAEWISRNRDVPADSLMNFDPVMVYAGRGNCEGQMVRIMQGRGSDIKELVSIKFIFGDMAFSRHVAAVLDDAFHEGLFC